MIIKSVFLKIYKKLTYKGIMDFEKDEPDIFEWKKFIGLIREPKDEIERSYAKYSCRMYYFSRPYIILANIVAIVAFAFSIPIILRKPKKINKKNSRKGFLLVKSPTVNYEDILPMEIGEEYGDMKLVDRPERKTWYLIDSARAFLMQSIKKYPFKFYFNYILLRELCMGSVLVNNYNSKAIVVYVQERNIASPLLTDICEENGIDFVTFMHGEYILQLIQGFMKFTKFYIWDDHYKKMFVEDLRCEPDQFVIYTPKKLRGICEPEKSKDSYEFYATYYFGAESINRINKISKAFKIFEKQGKKCKIRPHPRRSNMKELYKAFEGFIIEDTDLVSLEESLDSSLYTIALSSTVLSEAYYSGKEIVIDDYSEPERYKNLKKRKYIMLYKPHKLLTELLSE